MSNVSPINKEFRTAPDQQSGQMSNTPASQQKISAANSEPSDDLSRLYDAKVMMVDDEPLNLEVTQIYLEAAGYSQFVSTDDPMKAVALLDSERPDVLLLDVKMPGKSGFEILGEMKQKQMLQDVPTIVLTASSDAETKLQALELGATDFLAKPVDPSELVLRMRNTLAAKAYRDRLANYDRLTGLPNRRTFIERLEWALDYAPRRNKPGAALLIDLDGFKRINDALGPALGDELLQLVAGRIGTVLRLVEILSKFQTDEARPTLSRMASDEFAMLLPVLSRPDSAAQVAQRVLEAVASPFSLGGQELQITCGIGIAVFPDDGMDTDSIVRNASVAMHHAKREKKHSYQFYSHELNARALHRLSLGNELRKAIERNELRLLYQPKNDIQTGKVCGCEALVRWLHPEFGLVGPDEFIELAEETGLINSFGEWVMRAACMQIKAWQSAGLTAPRMSVNVSSHQFLEARLPDTLRRILDQTGADPASLGIEITEGMLLKNAEANVKVLEDLKAMGIRLSMDDFGTGYSSLSYLNSFPLDELKIDRSFMAEIQQDGDRSAIVSAIIAMAHSMEMKVVAEGVENEHQLQFLKAHGCDEYQGFMVSKPVLPKEFAERFLGATYRAQETPD
ncbi:MAG: EAL domain-containing protein [Betaproteobacteria bacterium]|nr:MAG: EAL domain-containing protein [Betaproteobacteria bacterium]